ncbi:hypothetical protein J4Q44_G00301740 [Coregonus suidteri]|uniref:Uncharacterized protein n=1 Tax=Coregonus suidteri TaxID=861788 RepID=A0AAN8L0H4_9TELE
MPQAYSDSVFKVLRWHYYRGLSCTEQFNDLSMAQQNIGFSLLLPSLSWYFLYQLFLKETNCPLSLFKTPAC